MKQTSLKIKVKSIKISKSEILKALKDHVGLEEADLVAIGEILPVVVVIFAKDHYEKGLSYQELSEWALDKAFDKRPNPVCTLQSLYNSRVLDARKYVTVSCLAQMIQDRFLRML